MVTVFGDQLTITFTAVQCCECSCWFGIDSQQRAKLLENGNWFYCPNGHQQHYSESEVKKLKRHLKFAENQAAIALRKAENERRSKIAYKGQLTKTKNNFAKGKCPCCGYGFQNLANHMSAKHADYEAENVE